MSAVISARSSSSSAPSVVSASSSSLHTLLSFYRNTLRGLLEGAGEASGRASRRCIFCTSFVLSFTLTLTLLWLIMKRCRSSLFRRPTEVFRSLTSLAWTGESLKMVLVVRRDLKMGSGKVAAQCAHAGVAMVEELLALKSATREEAANGTAAAHDPVSASWLCWYEAWHATGSAKVALQCPDELTLLALAKRAKEAKLPYYVVRDAGRTQVAPGSKTVLAVGPGPKSIIDEVTGHLKLL